MTEALETSVSLGVGGPASLNRDNLTYGQPGGAVGVRRTHACCTLPLLDRPSVSHLLVTVRPAVGASVGSSWRPLQPTEDPDDHQEAKNHAAEHRRGNHPMHFAPHIQPETDARQRPEEQLEDHR